MQVSLHTSLILLRWGLIPLPVIAAQTNQKLPRCDFFFPSWCRFWYVWWIWFFSRVFPPATSCGRCQLTLPVRELITPTLVILRNPSCVPQAIRSCLTDGCELLPPGHSSVWLSKVRTSVKVLRVRSNQGAHEPRVPRCACPSEGARARWIDPVRGGLPADGAKTL